MSQQTINIGSAANDDTGDPLRSAFDKCNDNFTELYSIAGGIELGSNYCGMDSRTHFATQFGADEGYDEEFDGFNIAEGTLPSGWIWANQSGCVYRQSFGMGRVDKGSGGGIYNVHAVHMPFEADSYTAYAHMVMLVDGNTADYLGRIVLYNSLNGRIITLGAYQSSETSLVQWYVTYQSSHGAGSSTTVATGPKVRPMGPHVIVKIVKASDTNYSFYVNYDGGCWFQVAAGLDLSTSGRLNGNPDHIGFGVSTDDATHCGLEWLRIRDVVGAA